ncbi:hypothetical protein NQ315_000656 [Exocentrus adspersus]|uniref:Integrase catalytic domain-containing protein n=1 Tax=Exocentrus adspersus TaxID=1586481 RepID=A0AAV8VMX4_9CUCU|nr:hypothetical protein NQ315_000656 [Exocentrus adspersus]
MSSADSIDKFGRRRKSYQSKIVRMPSARSLKVDHEGNYDLQNKRLVQVGAPQHESDAATMKYVTDCIECGSSLHPAVNKSTDLILEIVQEGVKKEIKRVQDSCSEKYETLHENIKDFVQLLLKPVYERVDNEQKLLRNLIAWNGISEQMEHSVKTCSVVSILYWLQTEHSSTGLMEYEIPLNENFMQNFDLWQIDLAIMQSYARENRDSMVLDLTVAVRTKTGVDVTHAMEKVLKRSNYIPKHIQSDQGEEFFHRYFSALMKNVTKAAFAERLIRTLKDKLYKEFSLKGSYKWYGNILQNVCIVPRECDLQTLHPTLEYLQWKRLNLKSVQPKTNIMLVTSSALAGIKVSLTSPIVATGHLNS